MKNRLSSIVLMFVLLASASVSPLAAQNQQTDQDKKTAKTRENVKKIVAGEKLTKRVKLKNGTEYQGFLNAPTDDSFVLVDKAGVSTNIKYSEVDSIKRKPTPLAALIIVGAGGAAIGLFLWASLHRD